jgi:hypothetical protein
VLHPSLGTKSKLKKLTRKKEIASKILLSGCFIGLLSKMDAIPDYTASDPRKYYSS